MRDALGRHSAEAGDDPRGAARFARALTERSSVAFWERPSTSESPNARAAVRPTWTRKESRGAEDDPSLARKKSFHSPIWLALGRQLKTDLAGTSAIRSSLAPLGSRSDEITTAEPNGTAASS